MKSYFPKLFIWIILFGLFLTTTKMIILKKDNTMEAKEIGLSDCRTKWEIMSEYKQVDSNIMIRELKINNISFVEVLFKTQASGYMPIQYIPADGYYVH